MTEQIRTVRRPCPICLAANESTQPGRFSRDGWSVIDCAGCGFTYMPVVPVVDALEETIAWEKSFVSERVRRKAKHPVTQWLDEKTRWRLHLLPRIEAVDLLNRFAVSGPAIDLGCGDGAYLARLEDRFTPHGVEISKALATRAQANVERKGGNVVQGNCAGGLEKFPDNFFTAALLRSYLEHDWEARNVIKALFAIPDLKNASACIRPCSHPGQPNKISYAIQFGFLMPSACFS